MSENMPPEATDQATEETPQPEPTSEEQDPRLDTARKEAANYRTRLRDAETQLAAKSEQVAALQRELVDAALPPSVNPELFWLTQNNSLEGLLNSDGNIDNNLVTAAIKHTENLARPRANLHQIVPTDGKFPDQPIKTGPTWKSLVNEELRRAGRPKITKI